MSKSTALRQKYASHGQGTGRNKPCHASRTFARHRSSCAFYRFGLLDNGYQGAQMRRALSSFACIVCLVATVPTWAQSVTMAKPEEVGLSTERLERIGQVFNREIELGRLPGAVVVVARKGRPGQTCPRLGRP